MHVRILPPQEVLGRPALPEADASGSSEVVVEEIQSFVGQASALPSARRLNVGSDRQEHEGVGVEAPFRIHDGTVAPYRMDPASTIIPTMEVAQHGADRRSSASSSAA